MADQQIPPASLMQKHRSALLNQMLRQLTVLRKCPAKVSRVLKRAISCEYLCCLLCPSMPSRPRRWKSPMLQRETCAVSAFRSRKSRCGANCLQLKLFRSGAAVGTAGSLPLCQQAGSRDCAQMNLGRQNPSNWPPQSKCRIGQPYALWLTVRIGASRFEKFNLKVYATLRIA